MPFRLHHSFPLVPLSAPLLLPDTAGRFSPTTRSLALVFLAVSIAAKGLAHLAVTVAVRNLGTHRSPAGFLDAIVCAVNVGRAVVRSLHSHPSLP